MPPRTHRQIIETVEGPELMCHNCHEMWPATTEFFFKDKSPTGLSYWCRACTVEYRQKNMYHKDLGRRR